MSNFFIIFILTLPLYLFNYNIFNLLTIKVLLIIEHSKKATTFNNVTTYNLIFFNYSTTIVLIHLANNSLLSSKLLSKQAKFIV